MKKSEAIRSFERRLGYEFSNLSLLVEALTHSSVASDFRKDNQRLEFLGDRVLGLVMAEALLEIDQTAPEGTLAPRFNALVRKETCAEVARQIELGGVLKIGRSEMLSGGRRKDALLGDGMEAVIAAIYKDGGFEVAKTIIINLLKVILDSGETSEALAGSKRQAEQMAAKALLQKIGEVI